MKITVNTLEFKEVFNKAAANVAKKSSLEILKTIKLSALDSELIIESTDLENYIMGNIESLTNEILQGSVILHNVTELKKALKYFKDYEITLAADSDKLTITCGNKTVDFPIDFVPSDFVTAPELKSYDTYLTKVHTLINRLSKIDYAIAKEDIRPILTGIHFNNNDAVAIDGYRLAKNTDNALCITDSFTMLKSAYELLKKSYNKKQDQTLTMQVSGKYIKLMFGNITITSRLLAGEYPKYSQLLDRDSEVDVTVSTKEMKENISYITDMSKERIPKMDITIEDGNLNQFLKEDNKTFKTDLKVDSNNDKPFEISFNPKYLSDPFKVIKNDNVTMTFTSHLNPCIMVDENTTHLVLPVRKSA